jgi:hypothetical protein
VPPTGPKSRVKRSVAISSSIVTAAFVALSPAWLSNGFAFAASLWIESTLEGGVSEEADLLPLRRGSQAFDTGKTGSSSR